MAIPGYIVVEAERTNLVDLIGRYVPLARVSGSEWEGPCPKCGGTDRLHVKPDGWFCRQCQPIDSQHGWHDSIDFVRWHLGMDFVEAVSFLTGKQSSEWAAAAPRTERRAEQPARSPQPPSWQQRAETLAASAAERLWSDEGKPGQDYLLGRGLQPQTWEQFQLGYTLHWHPGARREIPAISIPWVYGRRIVAVRYRFINPPDKTKLVSLKGSQFGGVLYGSQGLPDYVWQPLPDHGRCAEKRSTLVLCEGEINAMSFWQVARHQRVDVLSMGSETAKLTDKAVAFTQRYGLVIVWMDKGDLADALAKQLPGAARFHSPKGQDANDLLQAGRLGELLAMMRWKAARDEDERMNVFWPIWDDAHSVQGVDSGTANAFRFMCSQTGRAFDLVEAEPDRWVTRRWLEAA